MSKAIAYVRVSTQEQAESGLGIAAQTERVRAYATMRGLELVEIVSDEGVSGGKAIASRPGGAKVVAALKAKRASVVIVLKLDRAFRSASDCLATVEAWEKKSITLHIVDLGGNAVDTSSATGKFMLTVLAGAAEMERNLGRERTRDALRVKRQRGERTSPTPYGFDLATDEITLVCNPPEQGIIREMLAMRASGAKLQAIADTLTERGIKTKQGKSAWNVATVWYILKHHERRNVA